jgi:hypothetical protein
VKTGPVANANAVDKRERCVVDVSC